MPAIQITDVKLYNTLKKKLGDVEAEQLVSFVKATIKEEVAGQVPHVATKDFAQAQLARVETKISEAKFRLILCAFVFWATQLAAMCAFLKLLK